MKELFDRLFGNVPAPADIPTSQMHRVLGALLSIRGLLPYPRLTSRQKKALSGYVFLLAPQFLMALIKGLRKPGLFPDIQIDTRRMEEGIDRAGRWISIGDFGRRLTEVAEEQYLLEMSTQVALGLEVLRHIHAESHLVYKPARAQDRQDALAEAVRIFRNRCAGRRGRKR